MITSFKNLSDNISKNRVGSTLPEQGANQKWHNVPLLGVLWPRKSPAMGPLWSNLTASEALEHIWRGCGQLREWLCLVPLPRKSSTSSQITWVPTLRRLLLGSNFQTQSVAVTCKLLNCELRIWTGYNCIIWLGFGHGPTVQVLSIVSIL